MDYDSKPVLPLAGVTVLVTRAQNQAPGLSNPLRENGAIPLEIPVLKIEKPSSWQPLDTALGALEKYDWLIFASGNAVTAFFERMEALHLPLAVLRMNMKRIAAIGTATRDRLAEYGMTTDFHPGVFVADQFVSEFSKVFETAGKQILWPRNNLGRTTIADGLLALGAQVDMVEAYRTALPDQAEKVSAELAQLFLHRQLNVITLGSSQTTRNFHELLKTGLRAHLGIAAEQLDDTVAGQLEQVVIATIGPITSKTAREILGRVDIEAAEFSAGGLVASLIEYYKNRSQ